MKKYRMKETYYYINQDYQGFSEFLKTLLEVDLEIDEFEKMSESEKVEFRRNFKLNKILNEK
jgi:hypothetical protein